MLHSPAQLAAVTAQFMAKTDRMACDTAVEWLSEAIADFDQYEQVCMSLGIA